MQIHNSAIKMVGKLVRKEFLYCKSKGTANERPSLKGEARILIPKAKRSSDKCQVVKIRPKKKADQNLFLKWTDPCLVFEN
jgi:hypothetical protein